MKSNIERVDAARSINRPFCTPEAEKRACGGQKGRFCTREPEEDPDQPREEGDENRAMSSTGTVTGKKATRPMPRRVRRHR